MSGRAARSRRLERLAAAVRAARDQIGVDPWLLAREIGFRATRRLRLRLLRARYASVTAPRGARFVSFPVASPSRTTLPGRLQQAAATITAAAGDAAERRFQMLGSGPVELGPDIDWHRDFKSGHRWPPDHYLDLRVTDPDDDSDAKMPWELSRCHHFLALARAARLDPGKGYERELAVQWASWLDANPPGTGINWACSMEVAIRAVNWVWALGEVGRGRGIDGRLTERIVDSLETHGRHIAWNLEGTPRLRSNHYLADVLGLLVLGFALEAPAPRRWRRRARRALEREILAQVLPDGLSFEASTGYHGLALEMFLIARWVAAVHREPLSAAYDERLALMVEASRALREPDGQVPGFGDWDDGRILPLTPAREHSHDPLLWLAAGILGSPPPAASGGEELAWTLGVEAWDAARALPARQPTRSSAFPHGGIYVLRGSRTTVIMRCGGVGQNGNGGHAHNDLLSYVLSVGAVSMLVDSGTYAYTGDPRARNQFRATAAHNTIEVAGEEINPIDPRQLFRLRGFATPRLLAWESGEAETRVVATHDGYRRLDAGLVHEREIALDHDRGSVSVLDRLDGPGSTDALTRLHLAAGTEVSVLEAGTAFALERSGERLTLRVDGAEARIGTGWVSDRYGVRARAPVFEIALAGPLPLRLAHTFEATP